MGCRAGPRSRPLGHGLRPPDIKRHPKYWAVIFFFFFLIKEKVEKVWVRGMFYPNLKKALKIRVILIYYKFYYIDLTNWYVTNEVIQYSFIILLQCHRIITLVYKLFVVKFVISLAFSPHTHTHKLCMKNAKANINFREKKFYKMMWQEYDQCYLNNIIKWMFE